MTQFEDKAKQLADIILNESHVHIISHVDADGLTSAAIICTALERAGINYSVDFIRQLTGNVITQIADLNPGLVVFTDLGSGMCNQITNSGIRAIISDHHRIEGNHPNMLNPHMFGIDGSTELSGSGTTFLIARAMGNNDDLSGLAVVGAIGDMQQFKNNKLIGVNKYIVDIGVSCGSVICETDIMLFGKQTRPIFKMLQYSSDPFLPGLTGNEVACVNFIKEAGVHQHGEKWLRWIDISSEEKQKIIMALFLYASQSDIPKYKIYRLMGEVYTLAKEQEGKETRDAAEYSTLLNATARYDHADIGLAVCMGDRKVMYDRATVLLANHRKNLVDGMNLVKFQGMTKLKNLQYFDAGSKIKDTIVGIIAGMSYSLVDDKTLPIIAFADTKDGVKVSSRGNYDLVRNGLNLAVAMNTVSTSLGGSGGGHDIAAGAFIPVENKREFILMLDKIIGEQLKNR